MNFKDGMATWIRTRPYGRLWRSLPALAAGLACAGFGLVLVTWSPARMASRYTLLVDHALAVHDFNTARVASQRRLALGISSRPETLFKMAEALESLEQHAESLAILTRLAPGDHAGYGPAHVVLAETLLSRGLLTAPVLRAVELHLAYVDQLQPNSGAARGMKKFLYGQFQAWEAGKTNKLSLDPKSLETHEVAGWAYFQMQDWKAAKPHLVAEAGNNPTVNFMLADLARATGDAAGMRHWNEQAEQVYRDKVGGAKADEPSDRLSWVQAELRLGRFDAARQILENGEKLSGTNLYAPALASLYAAWAQELRQTDPGNLPERLQRIQQGLACNPMNLDLIAQLAALSHLTGPAAKSAEETLNKLLAEGPAAAMRLSFLGMAAWQQGDQETAQKYMKRAYELSPNLPDVANNMALMMALSDQPNLDGALNIVQPLLKKYPEQPHYRETRGEILVLQGNFEEGIRDLEFALPRLNDPEGTERTLGRAYRLLAARNGNQKLLDRAVHYEKLAEQGTVPAPSNSK
jgi:tetratricopeptide (TPR) repeat protein